MITSPEKIEIWRKTGDADMQEAVAIIDSLTETLRLHDVTTAGCEVVASERDELKQERAYLIRRYDEMRVRLEGYEKKQEGVS